MKTLLRIQWLDLKRDRVALLFLIALPIAFFSIFASIFGSMDFGGGGGGEGDESRPISIIVIDDDRSEISARFVQAMKEEPGLAVTMEKPRDENEVVTQVTSDSYSREEAAQLVREAEFAAVVVIPPGFDASFANFAGERVALEVIYDPTNPFAKMGVPGILQGVSMKAAPDVLMERGMSSLDQWGGGLTDAQRQAIDLIRPYLRGEKPWEELEEADGVDDAGTETDEPQTGARGGMMDGMIAIEAVDARAATSSTSAASDGEEDFSMIPYYAAGIGVMFLLFSMAGAAGSLLKEHETGALDRVLSSNISMTKLLAGKWMFYATAGFIQVILMFVWGELVFGRQMDLFTPHHMTGLIIMAGFTAMAAAAFGILIASLCRTRGQLDGMSTIGILIMSAVGGSMVPRMFMPDFMKTVGKFTFNGQALDGFLNVFWESNPTDSLADLFRDLAPQLLIMGLMTAILFALARFFARRWEQT